MSPLVKFILVLLGLAYLISPADVIPEMYLPWIGWIDDSLVMWSLYHLLRYGRLPAFFFKKGTKQSPGNSRKGTAAAQKTFRKAAPNRPKATGRSTKKKGSDRPRTFKSPYEILGVEKSASWADIQTAYKHKAKQYHPDKLSHLGEEFSTLANEKFLEIQQAYAKLKSIYKET